MLIIILILAVPIFIWKGFVLTKLWMWFMVPFSLEKIGLSHAIGIVLILEYLTKNLILNDDPDKSVDEQVKGFLAQFLYPGIVLVIGLVVQSFM